MAKTVVFDRFQDIVFPHLCAGCLIPIPHSEMWITTGKAAGKSVAGKLGLKAGHAVAGTLGMLTGGAIGGGFLAAGFDALAGRDKVTAILVPVCEECLGTLAPEEKKQLGGASEKEPGDFFVSSVKNRILSCNVKGNNVQLTLENDYIATALIALNGDVVSEEEKPQRHSQASEGIPTAIDHAIIEVWRSIVGKQDTVYTYPNIPERKLKNARASYGQRMCGHDNIVVGLQDSTFLGSAKAGMLFTTRSVSWKSINQGDTGHLLFSKIDPSRVKVDRKWLKHRIILEDNKIDLSTYCRLEPLASFIAKASRISRETEEKPVPDSEDVTAES